MRVDTAIPIGAQALPGVFDIPPQPRGIVVFAWDGPHDRRDPRDQAIAQCFRDLGLATLLVDLVAPEESQQEEDHLAVEILGSRLAEAAAWTSSQAGLESLPVGIFGTGMGAAASLRAAADRPLLIEAVVSHDGRLDLATDCLPFVYAPALLLVHEGDERMLHINHQAMTAVGGQVRVEVVSAETQLLDERGEPGEVIQLACDWFTRHLRRPG